MALWEGFWEGFAANRCKEMQRKAKAQASNRPLLQRFAKESNNRPLLQRFAKESNEKKKFAKNLKTAGSNPLRVRIPRPPLHLRDSLRRSWEGFWEGLGSLSLLACASRREPGLIPG
jgi:hypothetical protein